MTDNANAYTSRVVRRVFGTQGSRHRRTRPVGRSQRKVGALHPDRTALSAYERPYRTFHHRNAALPEILESKSFERPQRGFGRVPPLLHFLMLHEQRA